MKNWSDMALLKEAYKINNSCFDESASNKMLSIVEELFKRLMLEQMQLNELEELHHRTIKKESPLG